MAATERVTGGRVAGSGRLAVNTLLLYFRMMVAMAVNLYTVRVVLTALGAVDYGIYDVVSGLVLLLSSASSVLATATQRFYAIALGEGVAGRFRAVFSASVFLYVVLAMAVLVVGETAGLWFVNSVLVIPVERSAAANLVFQYSLITFVLGVAHIPFSSAIISHENLGLFAAVSISESMAKFTAASLLGVLPWDALPSYAAALLVVALLVAVVFGRLATVRYEECRFEMPRDGALLRELLVFSGWLFFGSLAGVGLVQVISIFVNIFFGPAVGAARAISLQLGNAISIFTGSLITAARPAMIRAYTERSFDYLNGVFNVSNKFIFYGLIVVSSPLLFEMDTVLGLWLGTPGETEVLFSRLMLVYAVIMALNNPISVIIQATGRVREYHMLVETFTLLCVPATWVLYAMGSPAWSAYVAMITAAVVAHGARVWCLRRYYPAFNLSAYGRGFLLPAMAVLAVVAVLMCGVHLQVRDRLLRLIAQAVAAPIATICLAWAIGLAPSERALLFSALRSRRRPAVAGDRP
jgi:O-antigen/teichoic acid export membrane protein